MSGMKKLLIKRFCTRPAIIFVLAFLSFSSFFSFSGRGLPAYGASSLHEPSPIEHELARMRQVNPDFTTFPDAQCIVWLRQDSFARSDGGGSERTCRRVILGRRGLDDRWLTWNLADPEKGQTEILEAGVYSFETGARVMNVTPRSEPDAGLHVVEFNNPDALPGTFILVLTWRETRPEQLSFEGLSWLQEELPVWEAVVEVGFPASEAGGGGTEGLFYRAFPQNLRPEIQDAGPEKIYTWRRINVAPVPSKSLARTQRGGVAFSTRRDEPGLVRLMREAQDPAALPEAPDAALSGFRRSDEEGVTRLLSWLRQQPGIELAGTRRKVPASAPWTREEKLVLARNWLKKKGIDSPMRWRTPVELNENPPVCAGLLQDAVLELPVIKGSRRTGETFFYSMEDAPSMGDTSPLVQGAKVAGLSRDNSVVQRKIPGSRSASNRLLAVMNLKLDEQGRLSGGMRVLMHGAWGPLLLPSSDPAGLTQDQLRDLVAALFPDLQNYDKIQCRNVKGVPELSFNLKGKPGVAGTGPGLLAMLPAFEPVVFRALKDAPSPLELFFPFVLEQNLTIALPKDAERALVSNGTRKLPDRINYSDNYQNRRHRLLAGARCEVGTQTIEGGNTGLLKRSMDLWENFSARPLPVQLKR